MVTDTVALQSPREPVDHIIRPRLPWRLANEPALTECGHNAAAVKSITREQHQARLKNYGRQRAALFTCMTCMTTAERWATWEEDPRQAVEREIQWEGPYRKNRGSRLLDELITLAALVKSHPDEFQRLLVVTTQRREWNERKAKEGKRP